MVRVVTEERDPSQKVTKQLVIRYDEPTIRIAFRTVRILDVDNSMQMEDDLLDIVDSIIAPRLEFDFQNVGYVSSAFLGVLVRLNRRVEKLGGAIKVTNLDTNVQQIFQVARLNHLLSA